MAVRFWILAICLALVGLPRLEGQDVAAPNRMALVIGNSDYSKTEGRLRNPENDAKAVSKTLRELGFSVTEKRDVSRDELLKVLMDFRKSLPRAEVAVFYYAGHGISVGGSNYLIPLKSGYSPTGLDETELRLMAETKLFNVDQALADMKSGGALCNIVILDACRNTPLAITGSTRNAGTGEGLVQMTAPAGSLIAFATDAGRTALDGDGTNGLYTSELLRYLKTPGLTIEQVFKKTREGVMARSENKQMPVEYSRLIGKDIYLAGQPLPSADGENMPVPKALAPTILERSALLALAKEGKAAETRNALLHQSEVSGPGDYAIAPIEALLEKVKEDFKHAKPTEDLAEAALASCDMVLEILPHCLPPDHSKRREFSAKAHSRRGDALLLLGRPAEALVSFDAALDILPDEPYFRYNKGQALLLLGRQAEAKEEWEKVVKHGNSVGAKKLAMDAIKSLPE